MPTKCQERSKCGSQSKTRILTTIRECELAEMVAERNPKSRCIQALQGSEVQQVKPGVESKQQRHTKWPTPNNSRLTALSHPAKSTKQRRQRTCTRAPTMKLKPSNIASSTDHTHLSHNQARIRTCDPSSRKPSQLAWRSAPDTRSNQIG